MAVVYQSGGNTGDNLRSLLVDWNAVHELGTLSVRDAIDTLNHIAGRLVRVLFPSGMDVRDLEVFARDWRFARTLLPLQFRLLVEQILWDAGPPWSDLVSGFKPLGVPGSSGEAPSRRRRGPPGGWRPPYVGGGLGEAPPNGPKRPPPYGRQRRYRRGHR